MPSDPQTTYCDALLYTVRAETPLCYSNLFSLLGTAMSYAMVKTTTSVGLGTKLSFQPSIPKESFYYQALRVLGAFDKKILEELKTRAPLPRDIVAFAGYFPSDFIDQFVDCMSEQVQLTRQCIQVLIPTTHPFEFRCLDQDDFLLRNHTKNLTFSKKILVELRKGVREKLSKIRETSYGAKNKDIGEKLEAMFAAFTPLCTLFTADFNAEDVAKSYIRTTMYLPPLHSLHAENPNDPHGWYLEPGFNSFTLPRPIQISAASLREISYLQANCTPSALAAIKVEIKRDFTPPHRMTIVSYFGRMREETQAEHLGFDDSNTEDALHLRLLIETPIEKHDNPSIKSAKKRFNTIFEGFEIEARIHRLTLHLEHASHQKGFDEMLLKPQFSLEESKISFCVHRITDSVAEKLSLQAAGFLIEEQENGMTHCWRDFWTWDHFRNFVQGDGNSNQSFFLSGRERLLKQVIGSATKIVLDQSLSSIEKALDDEVAHIASQTFDRYILARKLLSERIHTQLFSPLTRAKR